MVLCLFIHMSTIASIGKKHIVFEIYYVSKKKKKNTILEAFYPCRSEILFWNIIWVSNCLSINIDMRPINCNYNYAMEADLLHYIIM